MSELGRAEEGCRNSEEQRKEMAEMRREVDMDWEKWGNKTYAAGFVFLGEDFGSDPESKSQIAIPAISSALRPFVASLLQAITESRLQSSAVQRFSIRRSFVTDPEGRIHPVSPFSQPVQATTIASSLSEFMDSNTLMDDVNNANRDADDDGYCVEIDDVGAGQFKKTGKRKREKKQTSPVWNVFELLVDGDCVEIDDVEMLIIMVMMR
ncbi:hypothetical protein LXL04_022955 [Taraxacum kok-saghyz]